MSKIAANSVKAYNLTRRNLREFSRNGAGLSATRRLIVYAVPELPDPSRFSSIWDLDRSNSKGIISRAELVAGYRHGRAFMMMWMDPGRPDLDDVADTLG